MQRGLNDIYQVILDLRIPMFSLITINEKNGLIFDSVRLDVYSSAPSSI